MKIRLVCTPTGFVLESDEDYEVKRKLRNGCVYEASINRVRNPKFHRLYFALINCSWECLSDAKRNFFGGNKESFRKSVELAAGNFDMIYSPVRKEWVQTAKSISFDKMSEEEFSSLYERIKEVLFNFFITETNKEHFEQQLSYF